LIGLISETERIFLTVLICVILAIVAWSLTVPLDAETKKSPSTLSLPTSRTLGLGLICFLVLLIEGAVMDWAGIYLRESRAATPAVASLAFSLFAGCLATSRLFGDLARTAWGSAALVRACAVGAALSLALAVGVPHSSLALVFFGISGFFVGPIAPIVYAGGGRAEPTNPGRGIAAVTTLGYLGTVCGPPLIGFIAGLSSLAAGFGFLVILALVIAAYARVTRSADIQ
jgi:fucose permease